MDFLSHPTDISGVRHLLSEHLLVVANYARALAKQVRDLDEEAAYYAGLFHDVGKLNPHYQEPFAKSEEPCPDCSYIPSHSPFSAFLCEQNPVPIDRERRTVATICVHGHHTSLKHPSELYYYSDIGEGDSRRPKLDATIAAINKCVLRLFDELRTDRTAERLLPQEVTMRQEGFSNGLGKLDDYKAFFDVSCIYSALLQADRGALTEWQRELRAPMFKLAINTDKLVKPSKNKLANYRERFHKSVFESDDFKGRILVLEAPTGIGKTRVFLDIVNHLSSVRCFERVYYFSPLLALSEDFEEKIKETISDFAAVLKYNHTFKGTLEAREEDYRSEDFAWDFNAESFNYEMVVTTTQRLLYTLFSNIAADKMKFISLKNSVLIVDEIQTLPRAILLPTLKLLELVCDRMNSVVILVSATVPAELEYFEAARKIKMDKAIPAGYLASTNKRVCYTKACPAWQAEGRQIIMFNTRKEAVRYANEADYYLSSGIRKRDRALRLQEILAASECRVVSTQVLEAGVDISFNSMSRQLAPLDNIIQAMGRLNRECESADATLTVFDWSSNGALSHRPYGQLEFDMTRAFFQNDNPRDSTSIYDYLPQYYEELHKRNKTQQKKSEGLSDYLKQLEFSKVWEAVRKELSEENFTVLIPPAEEAERLASEVSSGKRLSPQVYRYGAVMPFLDEEKRAEFLSLLNKDCIVKGVLMAEADSVEKLYDEKTGLDKWLTR